MPNYQLLITNYLRRLNWILNLGILFLFGAGLLSLVSTNPHLAKMQFLWGAIGAVLIILLANFDWRPFINDRWFVFGIYGLAIALLAITYFAAPLIRGTHSWIVLGPFKIQTSELAKLSLIILYSYFFAKGHIGIGNLKTVFLSFAYLAPPALLVIIQPDMGSAIILFGIWFGYLLVSGLRWKHILWSVVAFVVAMVLMWSFVLRDYQKERIIGLFNPEKDPFGASYNVIQSKIAVGSASFLGKGFRQGTQTQLGFLPEAQTDFIFSAIVEEFGAAGGLAIIGAFILVLFEITRIGLASDNNFSKFICLGASIVFLLHFIINIGSTLGLVPVIGVPFPFLSYGGSNLLTNAILIGMIQSAAMHKRF